MPNYMQYLMSSDQEYIRHNIRKKIKEIIFHENISSDEIKSKIDAFPDDINVNLLKNSVEILFNSGCLTKENLLAIGNQENFGVSYFTNGILKKLDDTKLIKQENLKWILKQAPNQLYFNIAILHKNSKLTPENLQALNNKKTSRTLSHCFNCLFLPQRPNESPYHLNEKLISDCSHTFFKFRVNPLTARSILEFENDQNSSYASLNGNLFLANTAIYLINQFFGKSSRSSAKPCDKLADIESKLNDSIERYSDKNLTEDKISSSGFYNSR